MRTNAFSRDIPRVIFQNNQMRTYIKLLRQTVIMQIETLISRRALADISALVYRDALVRNSLCITACVLIVFFA